MVRNRRRASLVLPLLGLAGLLLGVLALPARPVHATIGTTYYVGTTSDSTASVTDCTSATNTDCTLRDAIAAATSGADTIQFESGVTGTITLSNGTLTLAHSVTITGPGAGSLTVSGNHAVQVLFVNGGLTASISGLTIANGSSGIGGGIFNLGTLSLTNSTLSGNSASQGGGIYSNGTLTVTNSTLSGNTATVQGGGIWSFQTLTVTNSTVSGNTATMFGGGIFSEAPLTLTGSTLSGNAASGNGGGGIYSTSTLTVTNSTVTGNSTDGATTIGPGGGPGGGGGIFNNGGTLSLTNSTVSGNSTSAGFGGGIYSSSGTLNLTNTLVSGSTGGDISGSTATNSHNLIGGTPLLGTLGNYGGPTQTIPLLPGSPAIGVGDATVCANTSGTAPVGGLDQRGVSRPANSCDVGAFQSQGFSLAKTSGDNQSATLNTAFANPLVVTVSSSHSEPVAGGVVTFTGPASGAGIQGSPLTASIAANGQASVSPTANATVGGPYAVSAGAAGVASGVSFSLTNTVLNAATHFTVSAPAGATVGVPFTFTVTALDQSNSTATGYTGTVHFTSSDGLAVLPGDTPLANGTGSFSATLKTAGNQTLTATDAATSSLTTTIVTPGAQAGYQTTAVTISGTSGTFLLSFNGQPTGALAFNASAAQVQTALNGLSSIGGVGGSVTVTLSGATYTITFGGALTGAQTLSGSGSGGAVVSVSLVTAATPAVSQVETIALSNATGGTFTLSFNGSPPTSALAFNATAAQVQVALSGLSTIGAGNVTVSLSGATYTVTFTGTLAGSLQPAITAISALTPASITGTSTSILVSAPRVTSAAVACTPAPVAVNSATTCTATVTDTDSGTTSAPTGTVGCSHSGSGAFDTSSCTLSGSSSPTSCSVHFTPSAGGSQTITASYGGDSTHASSSGSTSLAAGTPPSISLSAGVPNGLGGWFTSNPVATVSATAQTGGATISSISCPGATVAGFAPTATVTAAVSLNADGSPSLSCTATDSNGLSGTSNTVQLKLDTTRPSIVVAAKKADNTTYTAGTLTNQVVTVTFTCSDATSGGLMQPISPQSFSADGLSQTASASCTDKAGNVQTATFGPIKIDRTPPSCSATVSPSLLSPVNGSLVSVSTTVTTSDALSGPASWQLKSVSSNEAGTLSADIGGFTFNHPLSSGQSTGGGLAATSLTSAGRLYTLSFQAGDLAGNTSSCTATVKVPATTSTGTVGALTIGTVIAGQPYSGPLLVFADPGCQSSDVYSVSLSWGDGTSGSGVVSGPCATQGVVSGTHTYAYAGSYPLSVSLTNLSRSGHSLTLSGTLTVQQAPLTGSGQAVSATEGTAFVATVASFNSPNSFLGASSYSASISWGDGTSGAGSVVSTTTAGSFQVRGSHTYAEAGSYPVTVTIAINGSAALVLTTSVSVSDGALSGFGGFVSGTHGVALASTTVVATLHDADAAAPASDFTVVVDWGDGSQSVGTVVATSSAGYFSVTGGHTYAAKGTYTVKVTVKDQNGATVTLTGSASIS